jgi:fumarate reductase (CoM/CoB) subunit A
MEITELEADVVVVGGGAAGTMAAIKSHLSGSKVIGITKGPWPSGNSTKALSGYAAAFGHQNPKDNQDIHFADVVRNGVGLANQVLAKKWVTQICDLTEEMRSWGLDLIRVDNKYHQIPWEGHSYPRMIHHHRVTGKYLMKCLGDKSNELGIQALTHTIVGGIFKSNHRISGVWAVDYRSGEIFLVRCKALILATGGYGALYPYGDNVAAVTGEGYGLAYNAGASMTGMEFGHFLVTPISPKKLQVKFVVVGFVNGLINHANARLLNGRHERFMFRHYPQQGEKGHTSEELCRRISEEIAIGNGGENGGIYLDLSEVDESFYSDERFARMFELAKRSGINLKQEPIELVTYPHDLVGGVKINEFGCTDVPGLYAIGELAGGSHGASRFGGSALADCLVYGSVSGQHAAQFALSKTNETQKSNEVEKIQDQLQIWANKQATSIASLVNSISSLAFHDLNMVKTPEGLKRAKDQLSLLKSEALEMGIDFSNSDWPQHLRQLIEVNGQITLCELIANAALKREESRGGFFGGHYRTDYPEQKDKEWLINIVQKQVNGVDSLSTEKPVTLDHLSNDILKVIQNKAQAATDYAESE